VTVATMAAVQAHPAGPGQAPGSVVRTPKPKPQPFSRYVLQRCRDHGCGGGCQGTDEERTRAPSAILARSRDRVVPVSSADRVEHGSLAPPIVNQVLRSPGHPLDASVRRAMESRWGADFRQVQVHTDELAARSAREVQASAYTVSNHIVFAGGRYAPGATTGRRLIAHELAHVVQQGGSQLSGSDLSALRIDGSGEAYAEASVAALETTPPTDSFVGKNRGPHRDRSAAPAARALGARALSLGEDTFFAARQYQPLSQAGRDLRGHELAHALQVRESVPVIMREPLADINEESLEYLRGYNDGRANTQSAPGPLSTEAMADYDAGYGRGLAEATQAGKSLPPVTAVPDVEPPLRARPSLANRLQVIEETGPAVQARLDQIIRTGGPIPDTKNGAKVIGAAIIDVEGYKGPTEMRAINGADTDALGLGAPVYHATSPKIETRTLSPTQGPPTERGGREASIRGPRRESIFPHINDAEIKMFEDIISRLPPDAKGTIYFTTVRIPKGQTAMEPYPACSGCIRASFEIAGTLPDVVLVSHAPAHPPLSTGGLGESHVGGGEHETPQVPAGKSGTVTDPEAPGAVAGGEVGVVPKTTGPAPESTGPGPQTGRTTQAGIEIGAGIGTVGLGWLAAYLKGRVDQKIAQKQIDAFLEVAKRRINANPDEALKKMMIDPYATVYAWVYLDSAVITTLGVDISSPEPTMSDSSPIIDLSRIEYATGQIDPSLIDSFPRISGGGRHMTTVRTIVIDIPLKAPPLEQLIDYAKARNLPLDDLRGYADSRYQAALSSQILSFQALGKAQAAYQSELASYKEIQGYYEKAKRLHNVELQKTMAAHLLAVAEGMKSTTGLLPSIREGIRTADTKVKYWQHILDLINSAHP
jgi:hypothetical protein